MRGARASLRATLERADRSPRACNDLVLRRWESGDTYAALRSLDQALELDATNRDAVLIAGEILSAYGYPDDAAGVYAAFLESCPDDAGIRELLREIGAHPIAQSRTARAPEAPASSSEEILRVDYSAPENRGRAPKISVVIPSLNQGTYLETTICSVLGQNYPNLELIVIDGGSHDDSVDIIRMYARHIHYWHSQRDAGHYWAVDEGFKRSTGEIMGWINSDDKLNVNSLHTMASIFSQRADVRWVTGTPCIMDESGHITWVCQPAPVFSHQNYLRKKYDFPTYIQQEGTFWRRSLWNQAGASLRTDLEMAGDLELWARFFRVSPLHTTMECTGCFREQTAQRTAAAMALYRTEANRILDHEIALFRRSGRAPLAPVEPLHLTALDASASLRTSRTVDPDIALREGSFRDPRMGS